MFFRRSNAASEHFLSHSLTPPMIEQVKRHEQLSRSIDREENRTYLSIRLPRDYISDVQLYRMELPIMIYWTVVENKKGQEMPSSVLEGIR